MSYILKSPIKHKPFKEKYQNYAGLRKRRKLSQVDERNTRACWSFAEGEKNPSNSVMEKNLC